MKKTPILITILVLEFTISSYAQQLKRTYYDLYQTSIKEEFQVNGVGEKNGTYKGFNEEGIVIEEATFKNGRLDGVYNRFATFTGKRELAKSETYKDGVLNGAFKEYGRGGLVLQQGNYVDGEKDGEWIVYQVYSNYELSESDKEANKYYITEIFYDKGKVIYPDGKHLWKYYPSGKKYAELHYVGGIKSGMQTFYFPNGSVSNEEKWSNNGKMLYEKVFWPNGQLRTHRNWEGAEFKLEEFEQDGSPCQQMIYRQKEKEKQDEANRKKDTESQAVAALESGDIFSAAELYQSIGISPDLITRFASRYKEYLDTRQSVWWLKDELGVIMDDLDKIGISYTNSQIEYCRGVIAQEDAHAKELKELENSINIARDNYLKLYGEPAYSGGKLLYDKSWPILEELRADFISETDFATKKLKGGKLQEAYVHMVGFSPETRGILKKELKKVEDKEEIRSKLGI